MKQLSTIIFVIWIVYLGSQVGENMRMGKYTADLIFSGALLAGTFWILGFITGQEDK